MHIRRTETAKGQFVLVIILGAIAAVALTCCFHGPASRNSEWLHATIDTARRDMVEGLSSHIQQSLGAMDMGGRPKFEFVKTRQEDVGVQFYQNFTTYALDLTFPDDSMDSDPPKNINSDWTFLISDYNGDAVPDLIAIDRNGMNGTELSVMDGTSDYTSRIEHLDTALNTTGAGWEFALADYNEDGEIDLIAVEAQPGELTQVHILDGTTDFQEHFRTFELRESFTPEQTRFAIANYDADGIPDLFVAGIDELSGNLTLIVFNGRSRFENFLLGRKVYEVSVNNNAWSILASDWNNDGNIDVIIMNYEQNTLNVMILDGEATFRAMLLQESTNLGAPGMDILPIFQLHEVDGDEHPDIFSFSKADDAEVYEMQVLMSSPAGGNTGEEEDPPAIATPGPGDLLWSDPAAWPEGKLPGRLDEVIIPEGTQMQLDVEDTVVVKSIVVSGSLVVLDIPGDRGIRCDWILVNNGTLQIGTENAPFENRFVIDLIGTEKDLELPEHEIVDDNAFLMVRGPQAKLRIHGSSRAKTSWTRLSRTLTRGENPEIAVWPPAKNWESGDRLVISSTDFDMEQAEEFTVTSVSDDGRNLQLEGSAKFVHFGLPQFYNNGRQNPFDLPLSYVASYPYLIASIGNDPERAKRHFRRTGEQQGLYVRFSGQEYLKIHPQLAEKGYRTAEEAAEHYILIGARENWELPEQELPEPSKLPAEGSYQEWAMETRAEVGLLSRNIKIQGPPESADDGFGGHVMIMDEASGSIEGTELTLMGQRGIVGKYPYHWHLLGDASGQFMKACSIHHCFNRAVTIHGTDNVAVSDVVAYDVVGHAYFLEDGAERGCVFERNLGLVTRKMGAAEATVPTDATHLSTFWITNPDNTFVGNVAAGSDFAGFWYALPPTPTGTSANRTEIQPLFTPLRVFDENVAHSNPFSNLGFDGSLDIVSAALVRGRYQPKGPDGRIVIPEIHDFTGYKSGDRNIWSRADTTHFYNLKCADNGRATFFAFNQIMYDSLIVGSSDNLGNPRTAEERKEGRTLPVDERGKTMVFRGHNIYDGPSGAVRTHFTGFVGGNKAIRTNGAAQKSTVHFVEDITFDPAVPLPSMVDFSPNNFRGLMYSSGLIDIDGSLTGRNGALLMPHIQRQPEPPFRKLDDMFNRARESTVIKEWGAVLNRKMHFGLLRLDPRWPIGTAEWLTLTRSDGASVVDDGTFGKYYQNPVIVNEGYSYTLEFPKIPNRFFLHLFFVRNKDRVVVHFPKVPNGIEVPDIPRVGTKSELERPGPTAYHLAKGLSLRLTGANGGYDAQYGKKFSAKVTVLIHIPDANRNGRTKVE